MSPGDESCSSSPSRHKPTRGVNPGSPTAKPVLLPKLLRDTLTTGSSSATRGTACAAELQQARCTDRLRHVAARPAQRPSSHPSADVRFQRELTSRGPCPPPRLAMPSITWAAGSSAAQELAWTGNAAKKPKGPHSMGRESADGLRAFQPAGGRFQEVFCELHRVPGQCRPVVHCGDTYNAPSFLDSCSPHPCSFSWDHLPSQLLAPRPSTVSAFGGTPRRGK